jgi:nitrogen regulatory protein PII/signal recognition particle receptor subunit beta
LENKPQKNAKKIVILCNYNSTKNHSETMINYFNDDITPDEVDLSVFNYRRIRIDGGKNYLFNPPGNPDFMSLKQVLSQQVDGVIVFVETSVGIFETDLEVISLIADESLPHVLFANREDFSEFEMDTHVEGVLIIPTIAQDGIGINDGLKMLLKLIDKEKLETSPIEEIENYKTMATNDNLKDDEDKANYEVNENENYENNKPTESYDDTRHLPGLETDFYKLRFFFHPIELDNVKNSMAKFGFSNLTSIDIKYHDTRNQKTETYRCSTYELELPPKVEMMMIIKREEIKYAIQALEAVKTEDISEKLFISPVEDVIRIRTTERGENAVD